MFALKLFGTHAIITLMQFLLMPAFFGLWQDNVIYQWTAGIFYIAIFWLVVYADTSSRGSDDFKTGNFFNAKGFTAGLITSIPAILIYNLALIFGFQSESHNWFEIVLRFWLVPYTMLFTSFEHMIMWIIPATILIFPVITGLSYMDGKRRRKKIIAIIERAKLTRIEKSKIKNKGNI